ncbi:MAG: acyloxyacyl hydrolase [Methylacidiphilales bacterium]|nr:acyloxyacyl hydrolase [Candidatus Methylacidiphilales bacterium]
MTRKGGMEVCVKSVVEKEAVCDEAESARNSGGGKVALSMEKKNLGRSINRGDFYHGMRSESEKVIVERQVLKERLRQESRVFERDGKMLLDPKAMIDVGLRDEEVEARDIVKDKMVGQLREDAVTVEWGMGILSSLYPVEWNDANYTLLPLMMTIGWQLDEVSGEGWWRGNTQFNFVPHWVQVVHGFENRFVGFMVGPQYNFAPKGSRFGPFVGALVGFSFVDSDLVGEPGRYGGQGQDFCFTFSVRLGARYLISDRCACGAAIYYQHWSNAGLSEPDQENNGLDGIGPMVFLSYTF